MKKALNILCKVLLVLIMIMPILGTLGIFPEPTADMYTSETAYQFIKALMDAKYIPMLNALIFATSIVLIFMNRTALMALLILPITVNIVAFHWFLDGGPFTGGAVMGNVLLLLNIYFLWQNKKTYAVLLKKA
jgi:putative oxidoreductase